MKNTTKNNSSVNLTRKIVLNQTPDSFSVLSPADDKYSERLEHAFTISSGQTKHAKWDGGYFTFKNDRGIITHSVIALDEYEAIPKALASAEKVGIGVYYSREILTSNKGGAFVLLTLAQLAEAKLEMATLINLKNEGYSADLSQLQAFKALDKLSPVRKLIVIRRALEFYFEVFSSEVSRALIYSMLDKFYSACVA